MKSAPNLMTSKLVLCQSARRRRGAADFDLASELRVRIDQKSRDKKLLKKKFITGQRDML
jgi:hypothetical protein